ncbi:MAG TPA: type II toxin-antitoxin system VapC family toxin [Solirubrobacteraceae bacterium]|nr:type II toxin-antitoxin system VapC family toxin [Solirubrobacteraceae bacterium]
MAAELVVVDASALVEALIGSGLGLAVRERLRGRDLHAPAHLDAEVLSALGRLHRAGELGAESAALLVSELAHAPIARHDLAGLLGGAWEARDELRLVDALYLELVRSLGATLVSTDARLARARPEVDLIR